MTRILSVSSSRADVGILTPVWQAIAARPQFELHVLLTGMHVAEADPGVSLPAGVALHHSGKDLGGGTGLNAAVAMAVCMESAAYTLGAAEFDCLLLMGDRLDMLPAACASLPFNTPIAHLHGGELTHGAIDDRVRHAISKMAHIHFASTAEAAARIAEMGEEPWRIHVTGGPGLDTLRLASKLSTEDLAAALKLPFSGPFILATVHPETNSDDPAAPLGALLPALDQLKIPTLFTAPNSDPGGKTLRGQIDAFIPNRPWAAFRASLGKFYPSALQNAAVMVGNSSSGLIEAGYFGLPVVNVGARQMGRSAGPNVHSVPNDRQAVLVALQAALRGGRTAAFSPYGDGYASSRIADILGNLPARAKLLYKSHHQPYEPAGFVEPWMTSGISDPVLRKGK